MDPYLSAEALDMSEQERSAFIQVMEHFRAPAPCRLLPDDDREYIRGLMPEDGVETRLGFSMSYQAHALKDDERPAAYECGAVACIGGHVSLVMQGLDVFSNGCLLLTKEQSTTANVYVGSADDDDPKQALFYPPEDQVKYSRWRSITPETAAFAMENFLTKGAPDWRDALQRGGQFHLIVEADED